VLTYEFLHRDERRKELTKTVVEAEVYAVWRAVSVEACDSSTDHIRLYRGDAVTLAKSLSHIYRVAAEIIAGVTASEIVSA